MCLVVLSVYVSGIIPPRGCSHAGCNCVFRAMCSLQMFQSQNYWFPVGFSDITWCAFKTLFYLPVLNGRERKGLEAGIGDDNKSKIFSGVVKIVVKVSIFIWRLVTIAADVL